MFRAKRSLLVVAMGLIMALVLAACGGDDPTAAPTTAPTTGPEPTATTAPVINPTVAATATPSGRDMEAYFKDQTIRIVVGFSPGGGYDTVSRMFAAEASKHFPGNPRFIVTNLPGSGGLRALQATVSAEPDGFTVTPMASRFIVPEVIGADVEGFDLFTANLIGTPTFTNPHQAFCMRSDIATTWDEVKALGRTVLTGTSSAGGDLIGPQMMEFKGEPIRVLFDYNGTSDVLAALDRGELDGATRCNFNFVEPLFPEWIETDFISPVFWWRSPIDPAWLEAIGATEPPHIFDLLDLTDGEKAAFELGDIAEAMTRMFTVGPDVPDDIVEQWRESFKAVVADPAFIARGEAASLAIGLGAPARLNELIAEAQNFGDDAKDLLKFLYGLD